MQEKVGLPFRPLVGSLPALAQFYLPRLMPPRRRIAEVAKRQTQWTQNPPWATTCGFKSRPRHQNSSY
jgi:hypothetical protein